MKRGIYAIAGIVVLVIAGALMYQALNSSLVYFVIPSEYASNPAEYDGRRLRLGGVVQEGTIDYDNQSLQLAFLITDSVQSYEVNHVGAPPELFKENTGVVVEGNFEDGVFKSDELLIKHSEEYRPQDASAIDLEQLKETLQ